MSLINIYTVFTIEGEVPIYEGTKEEVNNFFKIPSGRLTSKKVIEINIKHIGDCFIRKTRVTGGRDSRGALINIPNGAVAQRELGSNVWWVAEVIETKEVILEGTAGGFKELFNITAREFAVYQDSFYINKIGAVKIRKGTTEERKGKKIPFTKAGGTVLIKHIKLTPSNYFVKEKTARYRLIIGARRGYEHYTLTKQGETEPYWVKEIGKFKNMVGIEGDLILKAYNNNKPVTIDGTTYTVGKAKYIPADKSNSIHRGDFKDVKKVVNKEREEIIKQVAKKLVFKLKRGTVYRVQGIGEKPKELEFIKSDLDTLYFRHPRGYMATYPRHRALTHIEQI